MRFPTNMIAIGPRPRTEVEFLPITLIPLIYAPIPAISPERKLLLKSKRSLRLSRLMSFVTKRLPLCYCLLVQELDKVADWNRYRRGVMGRGEVGR